MARNMVASNNVASNTWRAMFARPYSKPATKQTSAASNAQALVQRPGTVPSTVKKVVVKLSAEVGGLLRTGTRPTLNRRTEPARPSEHLIYLEGNSCSDVGRELFSMTLLRGAHGPRCHGGRA